MAKKKAVPVLSVNGPSLIGFPIFPVWFARKQPFTPPMVPFFRGHVFGGNAHSERSDFNVSEFHLDSKGESQRPQQSCWAPSTLVVPSHPLSCLAFQCLVVVSIQKKFSLLAGDQKTDRPAT